MSKSLYPLNLGDSGRGATQGGGHLAMGINPPCILSEMGRVGPRLLSRSYSQHIFIPLNVS